MSSEFAHLFVLVLSSAILKLYRTYSKFKKIHGAKYNFGFGEKRLILV